MSNKLDAGTGILLEVGTGKLLFTYSTRHLSASEKVRFFYALKGRDGMAGLLKATASVFLAKGVLLCPLGVEKEVRAFLTKWRCGFRARVLLPPRSDKLSELASDFAGRHKEVSDVVAVGATVFLLLNERAEKLADEFGKLSGKDTYTVLVSQLFRPENRNWLEFLAKGASLLSGARETRTLFLYNSGHLRDSNKVRFFYALKGRGAKRGLLSATRSEFVSKGLLLVPSVEAKNVAGFFEEWGCDVLTAEVIVEER